MTPNKQLRLNAFGRKLGIVSAIGMSNNGVDPTRVWDSAARSSYLFTTNLWGAKSNRFGRMGRFAGASYIGTGVESINGVGLFCDGQPFTVAGWFVLPTSMSGYVISRAGGTGANRTFGMYFETAANARPQTYIRGASTTLNITALTDDNPHFYAIVYTGAAATFYYDDAQLGGSLNIGTAAEETGQFIGWGARTNGSATFLSSGQLGPQYIAKTAWTRADIMAMFKNPYAPFWRDDDVIVYGQTAAATTGIMTPNRGYWGAI